MFFEVIVAALFITKPDSFSELGMAKYRKEISQVAYATKIIEKSEVHMNYPLSFYPKRYADLKKCPGIAYVTSLPPLIEIEKNIAFNDAFVKGLQSRKDNMSKEEFQHQMNGCQACRDFWVIAKLAVVSASESEIRSRFHMGKLLYWAGNDFYDGKFLPPVPLEYFKVKP